MKSIQTCVFDIETLPSGNYPKPEDIKAPANYKKPETILAYQNDPKNLEDVYCKRALSPFLGSILCISWILDDEPVRSIIDADEEVVMREFEKQLREQFRARFDGNDTMGRPTFIAHNIKFDMGFLWLRTIKYGLDWLLKVLGDDPKTLKVADTMKTMAVLDPYKTFVSLDTSCKFFSIGGKTEGMDGSQVYPAFKNGELDLIKDYCVQDTEATYELAKKLKLIF